MKISLPVLAVIVSSAIVRGQTPPATADDVCAVSGVVINDATGEPLKKANVTLRRLDNGSQPEVTVTGASGEYSIENIEPGRYRLYAERNGFVRQEYGSRGANRPGATLTLYRGQKLEDISFRLTPQAVITGKIVDQDNEPLASVNVQALRNAYVQGRRQLASGSFAQTNDLGEYRISGLPAGRYYVAAIVRNRIPSASIGAENYLPAFYPGTNDLATAVPVDVTAGAETHGIDLTLRPTRTVRVTGKVVNPPGSATLRLAPRGTAYLTAAVSPVASLRGTDGAFEIRGVAPGSYDLIIDFIENGVHRSFRQPLEIGGGGEDGVSITIPPAGHVEGRIHVDGPDDTPPPNLMVYLQFRDPLAGGTPFARVSQDGSFSIENVMPDNYQMSVYGLPDSYYLKSARVGDQDVLDSGLALAGGETRLDIVVSANGGAVAGIVVDARQQPAKGAAVVLVPDAARQGRKDLFKLANTDQNGGYTLSGIAPGDYTLYAFDDLPAGAYLDPDFLKPFEGSATAVSIRESGREARQLQLIPATDTPLLQ